MAVHNHWHLALMHMGSGDMDAALALYDAAVVPAPEAVALNLNDATALLWRLTLRGVDVSERSAGEPWPRAGACRRLGGATRSTTCTP